MESLLKAIELCGGGQAGFAKLITENLPETVTEPVTPQQVWNWLNRDKIVPAQYCPTIEKICKGEVRCEELNSKADWSVLRASQSSVKFGRRKEDKNPP
jgi:DNA-binding transcriptional regulator YdaS (Cro superfamily)